jgi:hypothetical protein
MGYRQVKTSLVRTYSTAYIKSWILRNKDPTTKMLCVSGVSNKDITPFSATNSLNTNYAWAEGIVKTSAVTHTNTAKLPSHAKSIWTTPNSIMLVVCEVSSIVTLSS